MCDVKQSLALSLVTAALLSAGCSSLELARFAPPGLVKYEDIASEKPAHPIIKANSEEYRTSDDKSFPRLADTPSEQDRPEKRPVTTINQTIDSLAETRDEMTDDIEDSRVLAEQEILDSAVLLTERRDELSDQIKQDENFAKNERKGKKPQAPDRDQ